MSEASFRNLAAAMRERDRRIGLSLASPGTPGVAQAGYLSPSWDAFYGSLREQAGEGGYRLSGAGSSLDGDPRGSTSRPGDADTGRSLAINEHLSRLADQNVFRAQSLRDMDAHNQGVQQQASDRQTQDRALAIANTPGVSQTGRPIAQRENGSYTTLQSNPNEPQPPVNRQHIAAQMAPGLIEPPAPPKPVTYGNPEKMMVEGPDGKSVESFVRIGSDGLPYDMARRPIDPTTIQPKPEKGAVDKLSGLPTPYRSAIDRILVNSPASRRPLIENGFARAYESGNEVELKDQIRQAAIETENVDTKNQVLGRQATIASLKDTTDILNEMKAKGVPTNIMTGTVEDLARKLGTSTNPEYVALANRLQGTLINYRRAATGVAFGEKEGAEYAKMFPNYRNTLPVNEALIRGLQREMKTYDDVYWESKLGKEGKAFIFGDGGGGKGGPPQGETPDARIKRLLGGG